MTKSFCERKRDEHYELYQQALDSGDEQATQRHMVEYLNYLEMCNGR